MKGYLVCKEFYITSPRPAYVIELNPEGIIKVLNQSICCLFDTLSDAKIFTHALLKPPASYLSFLNSEPTQDIPIFEINTAKLPMEHLQSTLDSTATHPIIQLTEPISYKIFTKLPIFSEEILAIHSTRENTFRLQENSDICSMCTSQ